MTRFGGALPSRGGGSPNASYAPAVPTGVPRAARRAAPSRRTIEELAREFEPSEQTIRTWVAQSAPAGAAPASHAAAALSAAEREELQRLRKEVRQLRVEGDILGKAAAWFARETGTIPNSGSSS